MSFSKNFLDLIFPSKCLICREKDSLSFCNSCINKIEYINSSFCFRCGCSLSSFNISFPVCIECKKHKRRFSFECARAVGIFDEVLRDAINKFKYKKKKILAKPLGELLVNYLKEDKKNKFQIRGNYELCNLTSYYFPEIHNFDFVIPVPIHKKRVKLREFNQSELLANVIYENFKIPILNNCLIKNIDTASQTELSYEQRLKNVKGAFIVKNKEKIKQKTILLIDDVFTTGSTVNECSITLKKEGAKKVYVLTLARSKSVYE
jgi:ComF family protein